MSEAQDLDRSVAAELLTRLEQVLRLTNSIVWVVDLDALSVDYFGPVEEVTGLPLHELDDPLTLASKTIHPDDQLEVEEAYDRLLAGEVESVDIEYRTRPDAGPVRWIRTQTVLEEGQKGPTLVGFSTEITRLKEQEARLKEFAGVVSHDLRNPLNVAEARLEMARQEGDSEHLSAVAGALGRMEMLIDDLLVLARAGEALGELAAVNLEGLVRECWATVETADATLVVESDATIRADRSRLRQLIENLFRNAVQHGGEAVTVRVGTLDDGFYVEDDGAGMSASQRAEVFQSEAAGTDSTSGLGLMIVAQVADAHGWDVRAVESASGGARFEFTHVERV